MDVFGGRVQYAISGGAPLDTDITHFFNGIGLPILEGYGMTETCAPATVNPAEGYKIGTVGLPLEDISIGITDDGEICIKGRDICRGYHNNPELTKRQIADGWLHTGDLGTIDDDGFLTITGRKKDMIITAGGKNVSPEMLEASVMSSPVVAQCVAVGDRKPFIAAIITLDLSDANDWLRGQGAAEVPDLDEAVKNPIIRAEVKRAVDKANTQVSRAESIRKFEIIPDTISQDNGMLTASLKITAGSVKPVSGAANSYRSASVAFIYPLSISIVFIFEALMVRSGSSRVTDFVVPDGLLPADTFFIADAMYPRDLSCAMNAHIWARSRA